MTRFKQFKLKGASQSQEVPQPAMIFDLDGTLVDSAYEHVLAWRETFDEPERASGLPCWTPARHMPAHLCPEGRYEGVAKEIRTIFGADRTLVKHKIHGNVMSSLKFGPGELGEFVL
jgi:hypothetical protein